MRDAEKVLREAAEWLDLTQPVALTFMGVLGHVVDHDEARSIVAGLLERPALRQLPVDQRQRQHQ